MMGPVHLARTERQARDNVRHGLERVFGYLSHIIPLPTLTATDFDDLIDQINGLGGGVIGTPQMAVDSIGRLAEQSGGFGCYLLQGAELANRPATLESYQLFAEEVAPHFQGQAQPLLDSHRWLLDAPSATPGVSRWVAETTEAIKLEDRRLRLGTTLLTLSAGPAGAREEKGSVLCSCWLLPGSSTAR